MLQAFLLTRQWRDTREGVVLDFWWATEQGARWTQTLGQEVVFFIARADAGEAMPLLRNLRHWRSAEVAMPNNYSIAPVFIIGKPIFAHQSDT